MFQRIRQTINDNPNELRPCMIIDHPEVYKEVSAYEGVYFTHDGADNVVGEIAPKLKRFSESYGKIADETWGKEYNNGS